MGIDKFKRVVWRLREQGLTTATRKQLNAAIMTEVGTDPRTLKKTIKAMKMLKFIKGVHAHTFIIGEGI